MAKKKSTVKHFGKDPIIVADVKKDTNFRNESGSLPHFIICDIHGNTFRRQGGRPVERTVIEHGKPVKQQIWQGGRVTGWDSLG